jgi:hypothetical protein
MSNHVRFFGVFGLIFVLFCLLRHKKISTLVFLIVWVIKWLISGQRVKSSKIRICDGVYYFHKMFKLGYDIFFDR